VLGKKRLKALGRRLLRGLETGPVFATDDVRLGRDVSFGRNVVFNCEKVRIGDGAAFGDNVVVNSTTFEIGDFATVYNSCFFPGPGSLFIGHNFWLGTGAIVDCQGGTRIGNNVGVGAGSQLWTHMVFGDVLAGCRFHSRKQLIIHDDVWFVGQCLVSPITAGPRSMALLGSLVVRDMEADHTYGGAPAADVTSRVGSQFNPTSPQERRANLYSRIESFAAKSGERQVFSKVRIATEGGDLRDASDSVTVFNVVDRTYSKNGSDLERRLIRFLLPEAKFVPVSFEG
jgi:acetyltransferase-like isoleucine patch superfamily enzyme